MTSSSQGPAVLGDSWWHKSYITLARGRAHLRDNYRRVEPAQSQLCTWR